MAHLREVRRVLDGRKADDEAGVRRRDVASAGANIQEQVEKEELGTAEKVRCGNTDLFLSFTYMMCGIITHNPTSLRFPSFPRPCSFFGKQEA